MLPLIQNISQITDIALPSIEFGLNRYFAYCHQGDAANFSCKFPHVQKTGVTVDKDIIWSEKSKLNSHYAMKQKGSFFRQVYYALRTRRTYTYEYVCVHMYVGISCKSAKVVPQRPL